jgi:hypothetical protein
VFLSILWTAHPAAADPSPPNSFAGQVISDSKTGRVGIGTTEAQTTLDVYKGEIKIGSSGAACSAALAGALRSANARLEFCDGASWRNVSIDKAQ